MPLLPPPCKRGRPRRAGLRDVFDAILHIGREGCARRGLPKDFPAFTTVQNRFRAWSRSGVLDRVRGRLAERVRLREGRSAEPTAGIIDSQSVPTPASGPDACGWDGGKKVKGRKRHLAADAVGSPLAALVHPADVQDRDGAVPAGSCKQERLVDMVMDNFKVKSLEAIGTINQDLDVGVIRVAGARLQELGGRNALVRVSTIRKGRRVKSLVRIVRAKTTEPDLATDEIALQYDDRLELGINNAGEQRELSIKRVWQWPALPCFLLFHTSPLVKKEAGFAIALLFVGLFVGFLLGFLVPSDR